MALKAMPMVSEQIYLGDLSPAVKEAEGECPETERAWVIVRQATEADYQDRAALRSKVSFSYDRDSLLPRETREVNVRKLWEMEVYRCLCDAGNILDRKGKPLFKFVDKGPYRAFEGGLSDFQPLYGSLQSFITDAMRMAVYKLNPEWGFSPVEEEEKAGEERQGED